MWTSPPPHTHTPRVCLFYCLYWLFLSLIQADMDISRCFHVLLSLKYEPHRMAGWKDGRKETADGASVYRYCSLFKYRVLSSPDQELQLPHLCWTKGLQCCFLSLNSMCCQSWTTYEPSLYFYFSFVLFWMRNLLPLICKCCEDERRSQQLRAIKILIHACCWTTSL